MHHRWLIIFLGALLEGPVEAKIITLTALARLRAETEIDL